MLGLELEHDNSMQHFSLTIISPGIHSSKKGKAAASRRPQQGFGWQKKKAFDKAKKFKKWKSLSDDKRQFSR